MRSEKKWYTMVYDATGDLEGDLLIGYDLIPMNDKLNVTLTSYNFYSFRLFQFILKRFLVL